jgi:hypothetical protein
MCVAVRLSLCWTTIWSHKACLFQIVLHVWSACIICLHFDSILNSHMLRLLPSFVGIIIHSNTDWKFLRPCLISHLNPHVMIQSVQVIVLTGISSTRVFTEIPLYWNFPDRYGIFSMLQHGNTLKDHAGSATWEKPAKHGHLLFESPLCCFHSCQPGHDNHRCYVVICCCCWASP